MLYRKFDLINIWLKGEFAVVPTAKICGRSLSSKIPIDMNSIFMKLYITWPQKFLIFEVIFVDFRLTKNIFFLWDWKFRREEH